MSIGGPNEEGLDNLSKETAVCKFCGKYQKRFLVFAGQQFYANGGGNDIITTDCKTQEDAIEHAKSIMGKSFTTNEWIDEDGDVHVEMEIEWVHVFDLKLCEIIFRVGEVYGNEDGIVILEK